MSYLLPLGPFDRSLRGPQRVVLRADGERISDVEHHAGFHARGCAKRLRRLPLTHSYALANRICGVHSHHHAWAWTMGLERLAGIDVPPRAEALRLLLAEAERIASHLHDAARIVAVLGLEAVFTRLFQLREVALEAGKTLTGHRLAHDFVRPGGVLHDLHGDERAALHALLTTIADELRKLIPGLGRGAVAHRTRGVGVLKRELLDPLGVAGWLARASGIDLDLRRDYPYGAYAAARPPVVLQTSGDVRARLLTLVAEAYESAEFSRHIVRDLPEGRWRGDPISAVPEGSVTISVEAPSGALTYALQSDGFHLTEVAIDSAQRPDRILLRSALAGRLVDDAPLILLSLASCTACAEA